MCVDGSLGAFAHQVLKAWRTPARLGSDRAQPEPMTVHRTRGSAARLAKSLRPLHDPRNADLKDGNDRANGFASHNPRHSTISQIHRVGFGITATSIRPKV